MGDLALENGIATVNETREKYGSDKLTSDYVKAYEKSHPVNCDLPDLIFRKIEEFRENHGMNGTTLVINDTVWKGCKLLTVGLVMVPVINGEETYCGMRVITTPRDAIEVY